jgi:hypothetical protein
MSTPRKAAQKVTPPQEELPPKPGGRPRLFDVPTVRFNLFLPEETAKLIRHFAIDQGLSPSQLVDEWARRDELDRAIARGKAAVQEGRTVDQKEAERRLSRWA